MEQETEKNLDTKTKDIQKPLPQRHVTSITEFTKINNFSVFCSSCQ